MWVICHFFIQGPWIVVSNSSSTITYNNNKTVVNCFLHFHTCTVIINDSLSVRNGTRFLKKCMLALNPPPNTIQQCYKFTSTCMYLWFSVMSNLRPRIPRLTSSGRWSYPPTRIFSSQAPHFCRLCVEAGRLSGHKVQRADPVAAIWDLGPSGFGWKCLGDYENISNVVLNMQILKFNETDTISCKVL